MYDFISIKQFPSIKIVKVLNKTMSTFMIEIISTVSKRVFDNVYLICKWID